MPSVSRGTLVGTTALVVVLALAVLVPVDAVALASGVVASPWFPVVLVGLYLARPFLAWPISALSVLVGYRYGVLVGVPVALAGAVATSLVPYYFGDRLPTAGSVLDRVRTGGERYFTAAGDVRGVAAARLAPTPAEAVSAAAGLAGVPPGAFVLGTLAGELPWTIAAVALGASLDTLTLSTSHVDLRLVLACVLLAVLVLAGPAWRTFRE